MEWSSGRLETKQSFTATVSNSKQQYQVTRCLKFLKCSVLVCHALPRSVTSSPHNTALVFGGCVSEPFFVAFTHCIALQEDGSLLVWDLREPHTMHRHHHQQHDGTLLRAPTYNTGEWIDDSIKHSRLFYA